MNKKDYYLGLDVGTNSVGYAVTDLDYNVLKFRKKSMWGVNVFEEGQQAADRRVFRSSRRRLDRRKQRTFLLQELLAKEIAKLDENFFIRLKESDLYQEDRTLKNKYTLFNEENYNDKDYNEEFPTIHHLIMHLINSDKKEDIRLIYIAVNYMVKNRGHFLFEVNSDNIKEIVSFKRVFETFKQSLLDLSIEDYFSTQSINDIEEILKDVKGITNKQTALKSILFVEQKPTKSEEAILKAISGGKFTLSSLFSNEDYDELEYNNIQLSKEGVEDTIELLSSQLDDLEINLLQSLNAIYDWSILSGILKEKEFISESKVEVYETHKADLLFLKYFVKKYIPKSYNQVFKLAKKDDFNYVAYSGNATSLNKKEYLELKKSNYENFSMFLKKLFIKIEVEEIDLDKYNDMMNRLEIDNEFLPKQKTKNNSAIPYQLNSYQLKKLLNNQSKFHNFLLEKDSKELTIIDKIISIMSFRIPYYVGPLNNHHKKNSWIETKADGKILPWNLEDIVDLEASEEAFIRRMTNKCTYLAGEDVLPKYSLLYSKFSVLNEINNIKINGILIENDVKQKMYKDLYEVKYIRLTKKRVEQWLISNNYMNKGAEVTGIDINLSSTLKSYHDFKTLLDNNILSEEDVENIIYRITLTTDKSRLKKYLIKEYPMLTDEDVFKIYNLKYSGFGRMSKKMLKDIESLNIKTGEISSIINNMWISMVNLMELLSAKYDFLEEINKNNKKYYELNPKDINTLLEDMYVSPAVKRPIFRGIALAKEIKHIQKNDPKKIFIEMARQAEDKPKRTKSRKDNLIELYKNCDKETKEIWMKALATESEDRLKSEKFYLYYSQLGKCMYSGQIIELSQLADNNMYDIDHIYPQSMTKDESIHNNKVLVCKSCNQSKSDSYPLNSDVQLKMSGMWESLEKRGLITKEKLYRLTRPTKLTDEEQANFINRQLVETRQSTKALAHILNEIFPGSEIVYVKANIVSEFRHQYNFSKVRILNDFHHAKDAYLNIVMGNVYNVKFTNNPLNFIRSREKYSINIKQKGGLLSNNIVRGNETAWIADNDQTISVVKKQYYKNDINYVRHAFFRKGGLYDQNLLKAGKSDVLIPKKSPINQDVVNPYDNTNKYGGYNKSTASFFTLVKHFDKNDKPIISVEAVELLYKNKFLSDDKFALKYCKENLGLKNPSFVFNKKVLKVNTLISLDGFRVNLTGKSGVQRTISSAMPLILSKDQNDYLKRIESVIEKSNKNDFKISEKFDKINYNNNMKIYNLLTDKSGSKPYNLITSINDLSVLMNFKKNDFKEFTLEIQTKILYNIINVFKEGRGSTVDLSLIGGSKNSMKFMISNKLTSSNYSKIEIIDQSPTGLFEKSTGNIKNEL